MGTNQSIPYSGYWAKLLTSNQDHYWPIIEPVFIKNGPKLNFLEAVVILRTADIPNPTMSHLISDLKISDFAKMLCFARLSGSTFRISDFVSVTSPAFRNGRDPMRQGLDLLYTFEDPSNRDVVRIRLTDRGTALVVAVLEHMSRSAF